jgi:UrcA family protein
MFKRHINLLAAAAALAFAGVGGVASATTQARLSNDAPSVVVNYSDLSLQSRSGIERLHARIRNAAETVCSSLDSRVIGLREQHQHCISTAVRRGVEAVGNDNLTQYHLYGSKAVAAAKPRAAK